MARALDDLTFLGISHLMVEVHDLESSHAFYADILGFDVVGNDLWPDCGRHVVLHAADGQHLILATREDAPDLRETGVHQAYGVSRERRDEIAARLTSGGIEIRNYREDAAIEEGDNFYFLDPSGNRIQLVATGDGPSDAPPRLDHAAVQVADILWAEQFYTRTLGLPVAHRVGWNTGDYIHARAWAEGKEDMAPGTRRLDKRYTVMVDRKVVARPNMQIFVRFGETIFAIYLANQHFQEPPEEEFTGTPRTAFAVAPGVLEQACRRLEREGWAFKGPIHHTAGAPVSASVYFKDPGGNFIELTAAEGTQRRAEI